jgi:HAD superfamily hydrolase (TIGR01509 family)
VHVEYAADSESKPSPRAVDLALKALGIANYQALFIGDSPSDEAAARAADVRFVWAEELFGPLRSDPLSP